MSETQSSIAPRHGRSMRFRHQDMDYYYLWVLGRQAVDASLASECERAAGEIEDGNADSWYAAWDGLAAETEAAARKYGEAGRKEEAAGAYLRACTYYRAPLFLMGPEHEDFDRLWRNMRECYRLAASKATPPIETLQVPYFGDHLAGYFWPASEAGAAGPTLLVIGGLETWAEDAMLMIGTAAQTHGYHLVAVDLPGQGVNPYHGHHLEAAMWRPMQAVVNWLLTDPRVDGAKLATYGFSWGGHIVFQAAAKDNRFAAMIANPAMPDVFRAAWAQQSHRKVDDAGRRAFNQIVWRFGLQLSFHPRALLERFGKAIDYLRHGRADIESIRCPVLCLAGAAEPPITLRIAEETIGKLGHSQSRLKVFTEADGSAVHCQIDRLDLPNELMFNWLSDVME